MDNSIKEAIIKCFLSFNNNDISKVVLTSRLILKQFNSDQRTLVVQELDKLVLEKLLQRVLGFDPDEYSENKDMYYSLTSNGVLEINHLYDIELKQNDTVKNIVGVIRALSDSEVVFIRLTDYKNTLTEIYKCYSYDCYNATIALCGKIMEIYLTEVLISFDIKIEIQNYDRNGMPTSVIKDLTLGQLYNLTKKISDNNKANFINPNYIELIKSFRNGSIHFNEKIPIPSKDQTEGILSFILDIVKRRLTYKW